MLGACCLCEHVSYSEFKLLVMKHGDKIYQQKFVTEFYLQRSCFLGHTWSHTWSYLVIFLVTLFLVIITLNSVSKN